MDTFALPCKPDTWQDKLRRYFYPHVFCDLPEAPVSFKDCLIVKSEIHLSFKGRILLLIRGRLRFESKTVTQNEIGECVTNSVSYLVWRF